MSQATVRRVAFAVLLLTPFLVACGKGVTQPSPVPGGPGQSNGGGVQPSEDPLAGSRWTLQSIELSDTGPVEIPREADFTVEFVADDRVHVRADCNSCFGTYATEDDRITIGEMGCTLAFCASSPVDIQYTALLSAEAARFTVSADVLRITSPAGTLVFVR